MNGFADELLRGLSDINSITQMGYISAGAFHFKEYDSKKRDVDDGYIELSINWNDDEGAAKALLDQKKEGCDLPQFKIGYCKLNRVQIEVMLKQYFRDNLFSYERKPIRDVNDQSIILNPYHGNLLLHKSVEEATKKNIQHMLAGAVDISDVFRR